MSEPNKPLTTGQILGLVFLTLLMVLAVGLSVSRWTLWTEKVQTYATR